MMEDLSLSAVLLAGGRSVRMRTDKVRLEIAGVPLWRRQVEVLAATGAEEILISGDPKDNWGDWPGAIVADDATGAGPLGGVIAGLRAARAPLVLFLAVDMPGMTAGVLRELLSLARAPTQKAAGRGVVPCRGEGRSEPLAAIYPREALGLAEACRSEGCLAVREFAARALAGGLVAEWTIPPEEEKFFLNLNTPQAWEDFLRESAATVPKKP